MQYYLESETTARYLSTADRAAQAALTVLSSIGSLSLPKEDMSDRLVSLARLFEAMALRRNVSAGRLFINMHHSGFPSVIEAHHVVSYEAIVAGNVSAHMPIDLLKERWLSSLTESTVSSQELLRSIHERYLLDFVSSEPCFKPIWIGPITFKSISEDRVTMEVIWSGIDPARNTPFVFALQYETWLDLEGEEKDDVLKFIQRNGHWRHAGLIGALMDDRIEIVHPKLVHGFGLRRLITHETLVSGDLWSDLLRDYDQKGDGFILFLRHETARSIGEKKIQSQYDPDQQITRSRWHSPKGNMPLRKVLAAAQDDVIVMPHAVAQHIASRLKPDSARIVTIEEIAQ